MLWFCGSTDSDGFSLCCVQPTVVQLQTLSSGIPVTEAETLSHTLPSVSSAFGHPHGFTLMRVRGCFVNPTFGWEKTPSYGLKTYQRMPSLDFLSLGPDQVPNTTALLFAFVPCGLMQFILHSHFPSWVRFYCLGLAHSLCWQKLT